jgi:amino acid adenylation domain-containing protein
VRRASRELDATPFMTLLAAYAAVLHRWSGQDDLAVGSPIANRTRPELEGIVGFFANTLVLRLDLHGRPTFRELVARVRARALDAFAHQDLPFERLVEALQPERALSHNPLFQVMFGLHEAADERLALPGLAFEPVTAETGTAKFDLNLLLDDRPDRLSGVLEYNTDLFDEATIVRLRAHLHTLLEAAVANPGARIDELPVMAADERQRVLVEWNATQAPAPGTTVVDMVAETTRRTPDAVAAVFGDESLTYAQLTGRANRLAHYLRARGVGPDVPVAICLERSLDMAVAVLATLTAGGAYVPLDPAYPRERLAVMLEDTQAPVVLAHAPTRDRLPSMPPSRAVWLDADRAAIAAQPDTDPGVRRDPESLLYVIYTSGSTGRPKGIALSHGALANLIRWNLATLANGRGMLQFASLSFDASFHEMFAAWASGRYLVMIPEHWRRDASELLAYLRRWPVETAILPVVVLHQWAEQEGVDLTVLQSMTHIVTTGEQLVITSPIVELFKRLPASRLHNHYGPSETHVVTALTLPRDPETWPARPSIGTPIWNSDICILDRRLNPVPIGVAGELYIGGANLARGYLGRPDLTAARFLPHPFATTPGARMYATGDLARWKADGTIEFVGRRDDQVKIRGFRVELGDVESALNSHPHVSQSVVIAQDVAPAGRRLVAYVVPGAGQVLTTEALRRFMHERLPDYMVPAVFMTLDRVALTPNGKVDRRALPTPPDERPELAVAFVAPEGPAEELMAEIWTALLRLPQVGRRDNFFHLGGHSLLATQLASRIRARFELDLPLRAIFEAPTIAALVDVMARDAGGREALDDLAWAVQAADAMSPADAQDALRPQ